MKKILLTMLLCATLLPMSANDLVTKSYVRSGAGGDILFSDMPVYLNVQSYIEHSNAEINIQQHQNNKINIDVRYESLLYRPQSWTHHLGCMSQGEYTLHYTLAKKGSEVMDTTFTMTFKVEDLPSILITKDKFWTLMENDGKILSYNFSNKDFEVDGKKYRCDNQNLYAFREESGKLYEYSINDKTEKLVFDTNLKIGDKLSLAEGFSIEVEAMSDTMMPYSLDISYNPDTYESSYDTIFVKCRRWHLRGVENPEYTDTWVEHVGSLKYGIHFPNPEKESHLLYSYWFNNESCIYANTIWNGKQGGFKIDMKEGHEMKGERAGTYLTYTNENGTLRIKGYVKNDVGPMYTTLSIEDEKVIRLKPIEYFPPYAEGYSEDSVDFTLPGTYPQADYQIYFGNHLVTEASKADNEIEFLPDGDKYTRTFSFAYDMSGFNLTNTYEGSEGKEWMVYATRHENWSYSDDTIKPAIPYLHYKFLLPDGFKMKELSYSCDSFCLATSISLATTPSAVPTQATDSNEATSVLSGYYGFDVLHSESIMDGYTIAEISIAPFAYDADKGTLYLATNFMLEITIAEASTEEVYHSGNMDDVIKGVIYNLDDFGKGLAPWDGTDALPTLLQESDESIWYDLNGRRVSAPGLYNGASLSEGIYLSKDKKILYRNK